MQTTVRNVIPALFTLMTNALKGKASDGSDVPVFLPGNGVDVVNEFAAIAYAGPDGTRPGVAGQMSRSPMGNLATAEDVIINCALSAATGDDDAGLTQLALVASWYDYINAAILLDVHLSNTVPPPGMVEIGPYEWYPSDEGGSSMTVLFGVHVAGVWSQ